MALIINNQAAPIQTVAPTLAIGEIQFKADKRSTEKNPIPDAERIRRVVIPANTWGNLESTLDGSKSQGLTDILRAALREIGDSRLKDMLAETPTLREVQIKEFTIPELLKWSEETATSRGSITFTREDAEKWFAASDTLKALTAKWKESGDNEGKIKAKTGFLSNRFGALAAKNHGLKDAAEAIKLMALIEGGDANSPTGIEIIGRLQHIEKQLTAKANEATVSMDDL